MADTLIERFTADGSLLRLTDDVARVLLLVDSEDGPDIPTGLEAEEAAELGLKLLRWVASKVEDRERASTVGLLLDRASRHIGVGL